MTTLLLALVLGAPQESFDERLVLACEAYGKNVIAIRDESGRILWSHKVRGGQHDIQMLDDGHILYQDGWRKLVEITLDKKVVWSYDASKRNGNEGKKVEVHAFRRLPDGVTMIAESGPRRILEVDREGRILKEIPLTVDNPHPHRDTRWVRQTPAGTYLACHENDGMVREYDGAGKVVWSHKTDTKVYGAIRLRNGNTLIATGGGNSYVEVTPEGKTVWEIAKTVPGTSIGLKWTTSLAERENGNFILGNCHAGPKNPQMFEITRDKKVVWQFRDFETFGNGLAAGMVLTDAQAKLVRAKLAEKK